nr:hypothetical protein [Tanacetum cinerariifolium]
DDDSLYNENIEYVEASPHDSELVSLDVAEIVIPEEEEIEDDNLREKLLNVHLLIPNIEALKDNPTPSSEFLTKSSSTSPKSFLVETNTFHNSLPEFENFYIDLEEISSGSTTTHSDISLPDYEAFSFSDDHIEEISSGSTTTNSDIFLSEYDSFTFDISNDQFSPTDTSDFTHEEFGDELAHIISPLEYDCFYFRNLPDPGELISILNSEIRENLSSTTRVNLPVEDDHSPLLAYVVWIFFVNLTPTMIFLLVMTTLYNENIEYVEASPHDSELVSLDVAEIVIPKEEEIEDDNLREKLLNVHLQIPNIKALKDNPTPSSEFLTKSSSTSPKSFLVKTNTFHNYLPEFENFYIDLEEISSGSTTTHSDISLPDYEAFSFSDDHIEKISSGSTTTHSDIFLSEYDSFTFDISNDQFSPTNTSDFTHEEFGDELAHIISPPEYDCFYFRNLPDPGELISILNSEIRENLSSTTRVNLPVEDDHSPLLAYVIWIFLANLTYPVIPL